jgi:predicted NAD/FAD-binding protein
MKIAVVGAGIAGLTAAYLLNRGHEVELFERNDYAGGHANTVTIDAGDRPLGLDTGFIVYNEHTYPGFTKLLETLKVGTTAGDMSISVRCRACRMEYSSRGLGGMLADRTNLLRPGRWRLGVDILRFYRDTRRALAGGGYADATIDEFVREKRYAGEFVRHFLVPLASAVWSTPPGEIGSFPVMYFLRFLSNHGIIGLQPAFVWRTIEGGSQNYVRAMTATFAHDVRLLTPVRGVTRDADGATVCLESGESRRFDKVVMACHANEALRLLGDASDDEQRALAGFSYTANLAVLHTDASMLPKRARARASWNYTTDDCRGAGGVLGMTYDLNRLQALDEAQTYCVSLNAQGVRPETIMREMQYDHPRYTFETLAAQQAVERINGARHTYFAGAHLGHGFHEDGFQSGARVAAGFGIAL